MPNVRMITVAVSILVVRQSCCEAKSAQKVNINLHVMNRASFRGRSTVDSSPSTIHQLPRPKF